MDNFKRAVLTVFVVLSVVVCVYAEPTIPSVPQKTQDTAGKNGRLEREYKGKRHRMPSKIYLEYQYDGNGITILAPEMYSEIEISVTGMDAFYGYLNSDNGFYLETGTLEGTYIIVCTTQDGSVFSGEMYIE